MTQVDASIYNAFGSKRKSPEEFLAERQALEGNALGIQSARTKMAQEQESLQRQRQLRNMLADGPDANALMRGGFLDEGMKLSESTAKAGASTAQAKKYDADTFKTNAEAIGIKAKQFYEQIGRLSSPQQAQALLSAAFNDEHIGPIIQASGKSLEQGLAEVPTDPVKFRQWQMLTADGVSKLEKHALDVRQQNEVERNNRTQNAISRGNLAVSQGNLGLSRQRLELDRQQPKGQYDADRGVIVDPRTGEARPVTMGGKPLPASSKQVVATEDERKAAGWYNQANNAWKNMQAAMGGTDPKTGKFKSADVARPGFADAVAAVPSFGLGEVVGNTMRSPERQKFMQAASSLSEAVLRAATGAGVNKEEALQKVRELTPVFGEDEATTKQKMDSIPMYLNSLKQRAGRAMPQGAGQSGGIVDFGSLK